MNSKKLQKIIAADKEHLFQNYGDRQPVSFVRGEGSCLYDQDNRRYIDFLSGIAVNILGYNHPALSKALHRQVDRVLHTSNHFYNQEQNEAGRLITEHSFPGKTLFVNSGTEANEAAIKLARRYGLARGPECYRIISFSNSFHGRTMGSMAATAQKKIQDGFGPLLEGFIHLPFNEIAPVREKLGNATNVAAVIFELIQGEGGIQPADSAFVKEAFALCKKNGILTIVDEVQTGLGRTGKAFAYQHYGVEPDLITLAKGLGGGVPIGAIHAREKLVPFLPKGSHGTTFGGNHLACAAACVVLKEMQKPAFYKHIEKVSSFIFKDLERMRANLPIIRTIRGKGLHIGFELATPGAQIVQKALAAGLVINCTSERVIRVMPPLNIPLALVREGMHIIEEILHKEDYTHGQQA